MVIFINKQLLKLDSYQLLTDILDERIQTNLALQPIVDLNNMSIFAYEVLSRWEGYSPEQIFSWAAYYDMIDSLENIILERILKIQSFGPELLFINLYPTLPNPSKWTSLNNKQVILEITEASPISFDKLELLRRLEYCLALDDVGTGSATFEALAKIEPEFIKLDRCLVQMDNLKARNSLIKALVDHATRLNAKVICEGIETAEQLKAVIDNGVHYAQGYYLCKPIILPEDLNINNVSFKKLNRKGENNVS